MKDGNNSWLMYKTYTILKLVLAAEYIAQFPLEHPIDAYYWINASRLKKQVGKKRYWHDIYKRV